MYIYICECLFSCRAAAHVALVSVSAIEGHTRHVLFKRQYAACPLSTAICATVSGDLEIQRSRVCGLELLLVHAPLSY